jgi:hypothetical protein
MKGPINVKQVHKWLYIINNHLFSDCRFKLLGIIYYSLSCEEPSKHFLKAVLNASRHGHLLCNKLPEKPYQSLPSILQIFLIYYLHSTLRHVQ